MKTIRALFISILCVQNMVNASVEQPFFEEEECGNELFDTFWGFHSYGSNIYDDLDEDQTNQDAGIIDQLDMPVSQSTSESAQDSEQNSDANDDNSLEQENIASKPDNDVALEDKYVLRADGRFECIHCSLVIKQKAHLKRHAKTHTGQKPYKCTLPNCKSSFSRSNDVTRHLIKVHKKCPYCYKSIHDKNELKWHIQIHKQEKIERILCPYPDCNKTFRREDIFYNHMMNKHQAHSSSILK